MFDSLFFIHPNSSGQDDLEYEKEIIIDFLKWSVVLLSFVYSIPLKVRETELKDSFISESTQGESLFKLFEEVGNYSASSNPSNTPQNVYYPSTSFNPQYQRKPDYSSSSNLSNTNLNKSKFTYSSPLNVPNQVPQSLFSYLPYNSSNQPQKDSSSSLQNNNFVLHFSSPPPLPFAPSTYFGSIPTPVGFVTSPPPTNYLPHPFINSGCPPQDRNNYAKNNTVLVSSDVGSSDLATGKKFDV
jgi:hypothetical protein